MKELHRRTWAKVVTWRIWMMVTNTLVGWAITGSVAMGLSIGLGTFVVNTVSYVLHERLWNLINWGRR